MSGLDPLLTGDDDPGDDVQKRFRYQHAYGLILLCQIFKEEEIASFWFEHHEDIIIEQNNLYRFYQIKTQTPENGYWTLSDESLLKAIKRFVKHEKAFSSRVSSYNFVSNCKYQETGEDIKDTAKKTRSPINFIRAVNTGTPFTDPNNDYHQQVLLLKSFCDCQLSDLESTLRKTNLIVGPDLDSFDAIISTEHLYSINVLHDLPLERLHQIRDEIISRIYFASSKKVSHPDRHILSITEEFNANLQCPEKKITIEDFQAWITSDDKFTFRFQPGSAKLNLGDSHSKLAIQRKKLLFGGLDAQVEIMERRTLAAEVQLIKMSHQKPNEALSILAQIEGAALGICSDATITASITQEFDAKKMFLTVSDRFRELEKSNPFPYHYFSYDLMMGVAGLLTGDCAVWWSDKFDLTKDTI